MAATPPYFWLKKISQHLQQLDHIPIFGKSPPLDLAELSSKIAPHLSMRRSAEQWRSQKGITEGLGNAAPIVALNVGSFPGKAFWIMSKESVAKISSNLMAAEGKPCPLASPILTEGFYRYCLLQALDSASGLEPLKELPLQISESGLPEDAFCIDVEISLGELQCWGRLAIEPALERSWAKHFSEPSGSRLPSKIEAALELTASVKIGAARVHWDEWQNIKAGDVILLKKSGYDPRKQTGAAYLMLENTPLFQVKIKHNKIELIDYANTHEEEMNNEPAEDKAVSLKETPVHLTVEIARLRITLEKLMQLAPGNLIELPIDPDQGVQLTVNGGIVGRAELVHLGEHLGLRIVEIG